MKEETHCCHDGYRIATEDEQTGQVTSGKFRGFAGGSLSKTTFNCLKLTYPSLNHVREHSSSTTIGAFVVNVRGVASSRDQSQVNYQILVDSRFDMNAPQVYVLSPKCENISHENIFRKGRYNILPQRDLCVLDILGTACWVFQEVYQSVSKKEKIGFLLGRISDILNNPDPLNASRRTESEHGD
tara:strand:- start:770 stop:1324 length:555 start_codon:yes stop_codon:yes gene_type:complete